MLPVTSNLSLKTSSVCCMSAGSVLSRSHQGSCVKANPWLASSDPRPTCYACTPRNCRTRASSNDSEPQISTMSTDQAYEVLGVKEGTGFEQILTTKNKLLSKAGNNADRQTQVCQVTFRNLLYTVWHLWPTPAVTTQEELCCRLSKRMISYSCKQ
jgi:hypothetical protein